MLYRNTLYYTFACIVCIVHRVPRTTCSFASQLSGNLDMTANLRFEICLRCFLFVPTAVAAVTFCHPPIVLPLHKLTILFYGCVVWKIACQSHKMSTTPTRRSIPSEAFWQKVRNKILITQIKYSNWPYNRMVAVTYDSASNAINVPIWMKVVCAGCACCTTRKRQQPTNRRTNHRFCLRPSILSMIICRKVAIKR